jgi:hypothetical protein
MNYSYPSNLSEPGFAKPPSLGSSNTVYSHYSKSIFKDCFVSDFQYINLEKQNKSIMEAVARFMALLTRDYFLIELDKANLEGREFIKKGPKMLYDTYARGSHFYVEIAKYKIPVFPPGTVAYYSGMKTNTNLAISQGAHLHPTGERYQKNGPVFDIHDSIFLARFSADVSSNYSAICKNQGYNSTEFIPHIYSDALFTTLNRFARKDADGHGIMVELKQIFTGFDETMLELNEQENCLFHLNEFRYFLFRCKP